MPVAMKKTVSMTLILTMTAFNLKIIDNMPILLSQNSLKVKLILKLLAKCWQNTIKTMGIISR